jgi:hypothetical protein
MPARMNMYITNGNVYPPAPARPAITPTVGGGNNALSSAMISRIQYARAGCGSCGKH